MRSGEFARWRGFAYVLLLAIVAVLGMTATAALSLGTTLARRDAEQALWVVGEEFSTALASYRAAGGSEAGLGPASLDQLLRDPRFPGVRRHLRQLYADPLTGSTQWGLLRDASGGIAAVYSNAEGRPIKQAGFAADRLGFEGAKSYADWRFGFSGR